jgi:hypothetical protein
MKSLDSESSGHLASIEISSEASETLVPSALELEKDMEGASGMLVMDDDDIEHRELSSQPLETKEMVETYDTTFPVHVSQRDAHTALPIRESRRDTHTGSSIPDALCSSDLDTSGFDKGEVLQISDGRQSPFEIISESEVIDYRSEDIGVSEDEDADIAESKETPPTLSTDESGEDERPH